MAMIFLVTMETTREKSKVLLEIKAILLATTREDEVTKTARVRIPYMGPSRSDARPPAAREG